jgi:photosynthetic reaction center cytochrome c subunit
MTPQVAPSRAVNRTSIKQAEQTYALMISMSRSLGVNCTYCHNTRQFASWQEAPPARVVAYRGELMVRDVNANFLAPLAPTFPKIRLGTMGDAPKLQCLTCHNGTYKPLFAASMAKDYPALWGRANWNGAYSKSLIMIAPPADTALKAVPSVRTAGSR